MDKTLFKSCSNCNFADFLECFTRGVKFWPWFNRCSASLEEMGLFVKLKNWFFDRFVSTVFSSLLFSCSRNLKYSFLEYWSIEVDNSLMMSISLVLRLVGQFDKDCRIWLFGFNLSVVVQNFSSTSFQLLIMLACYWMLLCLNQLTMK